MRVFILYDEEFPAYPILGVFSTLEKAQVAAAEDALVSPQYVIYEETLDEEGAVTEPTYHTIPLEKDEA